MAHSDRSSSSKINWIGPIKDLALVGLVYLLAQLVVAVVLVALVGPDNVDDISNRPLAVVVAYVLAGLVTIIAVRYIIKVRKIDFKILNLHRPQIKHVGYVLAGYVVYMFISFVFNLLLRTVPGVDVDQEQDIGLETISNGLLPLTFVALVIVTPISEEFLFRGYLYGRLKFHKLAPLVAALITSLVFGFVHGQINVAVDTFILSMVMIYVYEKSHNLWVTIAIHALKNTVAFLALFVFKIV